MSELTKGLKKKSPSNNSPSPIATTNNKSVIKSGSETHSAPISPLRLLTAFGVAFVADTLVEIIPSPIGQCFDVMTGLTLFALLRGDWLLVPFFIAEMIPGLSLFPSWITAMCAITGKNYLKK